MQASEILRLKAGGAASLANPPASDVSFLVSLCRRDEQLPFKKKLDVLRKLRPATIITSRALSEPPGLLPRGPPRPPAPCC